MSNLLSVIISNSDKHEFRSIWKRISCSNDVKNHVDCVIKRDVYPQKMHSCSKNNLVSFFCCSNNIHGYQEKVYHKCYCIGIPSVGRY